MSKEYIGLPVLSESEESKMLPDTLDTELEILMILMKELSS